MFSSIRIESITDNIKSVSSYRLPFYLDRSCSRFEVVFGGGTWLTGVGGKGKEQLGTEFRFHTLFIHCEIFHAVECARRAQTVTDCLNLECTLESCVASDLCERATEIITSIYPKLVLINWDTVIVGSLTEC